ncbi:VOC family protein [Oceanobacillus profundus]|uniref:VOC family protein n=1 Tax=Oceanobacillus profundus TaxID=372463 RepID=UPI00203CDBD2|nr:VOC family protein [Oceanobacillus profundus]MCM3399043.1 VOC family protein [Oceanobacillus profundus]
MLALDHLIIAANDPEKAAQQFAQKYGIQFIRGGKHHNWGTYNYLSYFKNNCYIEWLGIFDEALARKSGNPLIHQLVKALDNHVEAPIQYAFRTNQMDAYIAHFNAEDISYNGPIPGSRKRTNGSTLNWRMLFPLSESTVLPFLIEWGTEKNVPEDKDLINEQKLHTVMTPHDVQAYSLRVENGAVNLENASLFIKQGKNLTFTFA